ncbi:hypothetical protein [Kocuria palustris]|uniref:hypothetical protein n=1 Tax=Kocuria palustris TaxID=71999 RepID=UPI0022FFF37D|nr:hypothetical protein [Kocuria palustris]
MKSAVIAPALLAIAAVIQALGMHQYHQDAITVTGQLFFTLFLMGLAVFYGLRGRAERFSTVRLGLLVLSVLALVLTLVGWGMALFWFYPSVWMFYGTFLVLLITAVVAVASNPAARQRERELEEQEEAEADPGASADAEAGAR